MKNIFNWAVIGAGPAGIATVGKLIDNGINPTSIAWVDPAFQVGDFGTKWRNVLSNSKVQSFISFYQACSSFQYATHANQFAIHRMDRDETCLLSLAADPLQWITELLKNKVLTLQEKVMHLKLFNRHWHIALQHDHIYAKNVVLAIGSESRPSIFSNIETIPLDIALDPDKLVTVCKKEDEIAVFGSSHSAIIILQTLLEKCNIKKVRNFYLEPLKYAVYFDDWILFDNTGLKGKTAEWARKNIDGVQPDKLIRMIANEKNIKATLFQCNKAIYATGFTKRFIPVEGMENLEYNNRIGIIAPALFGIGIAFPEAKFDPYGTLELSVGAWKFMDYLHRIIPVWLKYGL